MTKKDTYREVDWTLRDTKSKKERLTFLLECARGKKTDMTKTEARARIEDIFYQEETID